ncbi:MAG: hypothetical protein R3D28_15570 [Geminicoccaceae bacterium]
MAWTAKSSPPALLDGGEEGFHARRLGDVGRLDEVAAQLGGEGRHRFFQGIALVGDGSSAP